MNTHQARWIWYPGDLEKYHALKQNFSRVERGCSWPAFWKSDAFRQRVVFRRCYSLAKETRFTVYSVPGACGYADVNGHKYPFGRPIPCPAGEVRISLHVGCIGCVPAVYAEGSAIRTDGEWMAEDYCTPPVPAAWNRYFLSPDVTPEKWPMKEKSFLPCSAEEADGGTLFGFETELTAELEVTALDGRRKMPTVYLGESAPEALDTQNCYYFCTPDPLTRRCPRQALRYAYLPGIKKSEVTVKAWHQFVDIPVQARFVSDDEELNRIFAVSAHTFSLCCDVFFLDGVKRDKWIWGGDAYQSLFVNRYLTGDKDIEQRTLIALRGNDPVMTHVNTILDYSLLWILSLDAHYEAFRDDAFLKRMLPLAESLMEFIMTQRDTNGFVLGREQDWVFIDWAEFDREGPLCAEQMLLAAAYGAMARMEPEERRASWLVALSSLMEKIENCFWDAGKGAYVDSFTSGKRHVTRHANILAIVFGLVDGERKETLARNVLFNAQVPPITTPYFRFFELDALCSMGYLREVMSEIKSYWGGMLKMGAATFWEEYDPTLPLEKQYAMYGDPYGKSLCHAWAASPVYLLARYFVGLRPDAASPEGFRAEPAPGFFRSLDCTLPLGESLFRITVNKGKTECLKL